MEIGYNFKNKKLYDCAFTHISYAKEMGAESNQRLEFIGDGLLDFIVGERLFELYPELAEGDLTKMRAYLVCEKSLHRLGTKLDLGNKMRFAKTELKCKGNLKASIIADCFEALIGAIYLDGGFDCAKKWILEQYGDEFTAVKNQDLMDYKSELQDYFQKREKERGTVTYRLVSQDGPDHAPTFTVEAMHNETPLAKGTGTSLKKAEQDAAKHALEDLR
ncbi:MAG: ribonuclease III [Clostridia bacterium]|nr:ribonuclease III [Clostridia bacterium]